MHRSISSNSIEESDVTNSVIGLSYQSLTVHWVPSLYSFLFVESNSSDVHFYYSMYNKENLDRCIHIRSENFSIDVKYEVPLENH
jgi:hypothetical protein